MIASKSINLVFYGNKLNMTWLGYFNYLAYFLPCKILYLVVAPESQYVKRTCFRLTEEMRDSSC